MTTFVFENTFADGLVRSMYAILCATVTTRPVFKNRTKKVLDIRLDSQDETVDMLGVVLK